MLNYMSFTITEDSSIVWNWREEVHIALATEGDVAMDVAETWVERDTTVTVEYQLLVSYAELVLSGDTDGVTLDTDARTVTIPADRPRSVKLSTLQSISIEDALDGTGIVWATDSGHEWTAQVSMTCVGVDAAASAPVDSDSASGLEATVQGPGTLRWRWRLVADGVAGMDVIVDGNFANPARTYEVSGDWSDDSLSFDDAGSHTVRFEFWNVGSSPADGAYLDCVTWIPAGSNVLLPELAANATPATVMNAIERAWLADAEGVLAAVGGSAAEYAAFRTWAQSVAGGEAAIAASPYAGASYLLGMEDLFQNKPDIRFCKLIIVEGTDGSTGIGQPETPPLFAVAVVVQDGTDIIAVSAEKVAQMFEMTRDLNDWTGAAKLDPVVNVIGTDTDGIMHFTVAPGNGAEDSAFLRIRVW